MLFSEFHSIGAVAIQGSCSSVITKGLGLSIPTYLTNNPIFEEIYLEIFTYLDRGKINLPRYLSKENADKSHSEAAYT